MENPAPKADVTPLKRSRRGKSDVKKSTKRNKDSADEACNAINSEKKFVIDKENTVTDKDACRSSKEELKKYSRVGNLDEVKISAESSHLIDPKLGNIITGVVEDAVDKAMTLVHGSGDDVEQLKRSFKAPSSGTPDLMSHLGNDANENNWFKEKSFEEDQTSNMQGVTEADATPSKSSRRVKRKTENSRKDSTVEKNDFDVEKMLVVNKFEAAAEKDTRHVSKLELKDSCVGNWDEVNTSAKYSHPSLDPKLGNVIVDVVEYAMDKKSSGTLDLVSNLETDANVKGCLEEKLSEENQTPKMQGVAENADMKVIQDGSMMLVVDSPSKSSRIGKRKSMSSRKDSAEKKNDVDAEKMIIMKKEELTAEKETLHVSKQELKDSFVGNLDKVDTSAESRQPNLDPKCRSVIVGVVEAAMDKKVLATLNDCSNDDAEPLKKKLKTPSSGTPDLASKSVTDANVKSCFEEKPIEEDQTSIMRGVTEAVDSPSKSSRRGKRKSKNSRKDSTEERNKVDAEKIIIVKKEEVAAEKDTPHASKQGLKSSGTSDVMSNLETDANEKNCLEEKSIEEDQTSKMQVVTEVQNNTNMKVTQDVSTMLAVDSPSKRSRRGKRKSNNSRKDSAEEKNEVDAEKIIIIKKEEVAAEKDTPHASKQELKVQNSTDMKVIQDVSTVVADATPPKSDRPGKRKVKHSRKHIKDSTEEMNNVGSQKKMLITREEETTTDKDIDHAPKQELKSYGVLDNISNLEYVNEKSSFMEKCLEDEEASKMHVVNESMQISVNDNTSEETSTEEDIAESPDEEEEVLSKSPYKNDTDVQVSANAPAISTTPSSEEQAKSVNKVLFVGNLPSSAQVADVEEFFKAAGEIVGIRLPLNSRSALIGFGFVEFAKHEEAMKAFQDLNGKTLLHRPVRLEFGKEKRSNSSGEKSTESLQKGSKAQAPAESLQSGSKDQVPAESLQNGSKAQVPIVIVCGFNKNDNQDQIRNGLKDHFGSCGEITRFTTPMDRDGGLKGIAYIEFKDRNAANQALELNGSKFSSNTLIVDIVDTGVHDDSCRQGGHQNNKRKFGDRDGGKYPKPGGRGRPTGGFDHGGRGRHSGGGYSGGRGYSRGGGRYRRGGGYWN